MGRQAYSFNYDSIKHLLLSKQAHSTPPLLFINHKPLHIPAHINLSAQMFHIQLTKLTHINLVFEVFLITGTLRSRPTDCCATTSFAIKSCTGLRADRLPMHDRGSGTEGNHGGLVFAINNKYVTSLINMESMRRSK